MTKTLESREETFALSVLVLSRSPAFLRARACPQEGREELPHPWEGEPPSQGLRVMTRFLSG